MIHRKVEHLSVRGASMRAASSSPSGMWVPQLWTSNRWVQETKMASTATWREINGWKGLTQQINLASPAGRLFPLKCIWSSKAHFRFCEILHKANFQQASQFPFSRNSFIHSRFYGLTSLSQEWKTITSDWSQKGTKVTRNMSKYSVCDTKSCQLVSSHNPIPPKVTTTSRRVKNRAGKWQQGHEKPATGLSSCCLGSFSPPPFY